MNAAITAALVVLVISSVLWGSWVYWLHNQKVAATRRKELHLEVDIGEPTQKFLRRLLGYK